MIATLPPEIEAFNQRLGVSLDRIHLIQDGVVEQFATMYKWLQDEGFPDVVLKQHLDSAKPHLMNLKTTQYLITEVKGGSHDT